MSKPKKIRFLNEVDLNKWYANRDHVFKFIKSEEPGHLRGNIRVDVGLSWDYQSEISVPVTRLDSDSGLSFKVYRVKDTYSLECFNIVEANVEAIVEHEEFKIRKAKHELSKLIEVAQKKSKKLGVEIKI